jgi:hypothetical protein
MVWDIIITLVAFAAQCAMAYAAYKVTVNPIVENNKVRRLKYEFVIWTSFVVGALALVAGVIRGGDLRNELTDIKRGQQTTNAGIQEIKNNPPVVNVNAPAPPVPIMTAQVQLEKFESSYNSIATLNGMSMVGPHPLLVPSKPVSVNFFFINTGTALADKVAGWGKVYVGPEIESQVIPKFRSELAKVTLVHGGTLQTGGHDEFWSTTQSDNPITADDVTKLAAVQEQLFMLLHVEYADPSGKHFQNYCRFLQAPDKNNLTAESIWHFCNDWSERK